ncbi:MULTISPECIES: spore coat U domain-containing protein [Enterobacter]|uniref:Spore coat U domain-containing protein n=1 Tax=Enterobacter rongchengensis TaxID=3030999 RepID=A0ABV4JJS4_9ENTR|nr:MULTISPECIES: spore coat U domain-containing protein [Enterobacter]PNL51382.1 SCPU domain-containing protein [Enterobacter hormaechei]HCR0840333.1 spore coat protein U domain-containing protein [Enterobacter cancerogenus]EKX4009948.1 spore coat protein U domain-containing protein [Enterobacter cloacae]ELV3043725.1 spore coat protein U domain-containing protein [Enterobacter chengduensis]KJM06409.1 fimbrial protein [Enterobacter chengduensis]
MKASLAGLRKRAEGRVQPFFALLVGWLMIPAAVAVTSQSFKVSATIVPGCAVATGSGGLLGTLDFGTHTGVESAPVSTSFVPNGALSIACTPGVTLSMSINGGQNYSSVRRMKRTDGADLVGYRLYSSSSLAANSEIGLNQAIPVTYTDSNNIALPLFGVALLTGFSPAGTYSDQLTVTLSW